MRKLFVLCGAIFCLSMTSAAQDAPAAFDASSTASEPAAPVTFHPSDREPWQLGIGYQYQHHKALGQSFHNNGFNVEFTRYVNNWLGFEATAAMGFGHASTAPSLVAKSTFLGGGPHVTVHNVGRFEPWVHGLVGWEHYRFTQTTNLGSNSAFGFMAGGGVDFKFRPRAFWRIQGDYVGTRFQSSIQNNYSVGTGLVLNF